MKVTKRFKFEAAHYLPGYNGPCANLHGHSWKLELTFEGPVDPDTGMVVDYSQIKYWVNRLVIGSSDKSCLNLDHSCLNDLKRPFSRNPTSENVLDCVASLLAPVFEQRYHVELVVARLYETDDSWCDWSPLC